jgi:hypothetical protein
LVDQEEGTKMQKEMNIKLLRENGRGAEADELQASLNGADERVKTYKKKALDLLKKSLKEMPAEIVIDYGEPSASREKYSGSGSDVSAYQDGILHDYVGMLYRAGDKAAAEKLGAEVARQLESILNYFEKSDSYFAGNQENNGDLFAAMDAYFKLYNSAIDPISGDKNGQLAKRTKTKIDQLYNKSFPAIFKALQDKAAANGESIRRGSKAGKYASMLFELQDFVEAIGVHFKYIEGPKGMPTSPTMDMNNINMEELMRQMPAADSVIQ